jgi:hypothetical protein
MNKFMSIFKKKIDFSQFIANLISFQLDFIESNFDKMVILADEYKILGESDKKDLYEKLQTLSIADILLKCHLSLSNNIAPEEMNNCIAVMYRRCLIEYKNMQEKEAIDSAKRVLDLIGSMEDAKKDMEQSMEETNKTGYEMNKINEHDEQEYYLCSGFSKYYAGNNMKSENWEGKHFAAFKLAKAFVKTDIVKAMLKDFKIIWN